jgi:VIT1/CCC1 family predicted Fe2+/Mn2+ transporter
MSLSIKKGISFGTTSGVITTLGMIVGVNASTSSRLAVIAAIVAIAIADAFSDAVAMHVSEESEGVHSRNDVFQATLSTFFTKFIFALSFVVPIWFLALDIAVVVDIIWGLLIMTVFNILLARSQKEGVLRVVFEHLTIAVAVVLITYFVGSFLSTVV